jgi:hypothetical protein
MWVRCNVIRGLWNSAPDRDSLPSASFERCPNISGYTLLDFSLHMMAASRERLARFPAADFVMTNFKSEGWIESVAGPFDCVVSMQAIHELRHKRYAPRLYQQVHQITAPRGQLLICDHIPLDDTPKSEALYMTEQEQLAALSSAGFKHAKTALSVDTLRLYTCEKA